jgi:hypothetical protein
MQQFIFEAERRAGDASVVTETFAIPQIGLHKSMEGQS